MTRGLLTCGVIGPLLFIAVFTIEGWLRPGYRARRHFVSSLSNGPRGWVQRANFLQCGVLVLGFAAGAGSGAGLALLGGAARWLLGAFGAGLIASGMFATDAAIDDPESSYASRAMSAATTAGRVHGLAGLVVFVSLVVAAWLVAVRFAHQGCAIWAACSAVIGVVVAVFFVRGGALMAKEARGELANAPFGRCQRLAIIPGWTWLALVAAHLVQAF